MISGGRPPNVSARSLGVLEPSYCIPSSSQGIWDESDPLYLPRSEVERLFQKYEGDAVGLEPVDFFLHCAAGDHQVFHLDATITQKAKKTKRYAGKAREPSA
jgi:hypothetical protein